MTSDRPKHDKIFRKSMENPIVAKEFLATYLLIKMMIKNGNSIEEVARINRLSSITKINELLKVQ